MPEAPLNDRELRIVRGLIDEYEFRHARSRMLGGLVGDVRKFLLVLGGVFVFIVQVITLYIALTGGAR